jgi:transcriptional regulator NrdR family protein
MRCPECMREMSETGSGMTLRTNERRYWCSKCGTRVTAYDREDATQSPDPLIIVHALHDSDGAASP